MHGTGVEPSPLLLRLFTGLLYQPWMIDVDDCGTISETNEWQGKPKYWEETCPNVALSTFRSHMTWPGLEPGSALWKTTTNRQPVPTAPFPVTSNLILSYSFIRIAVPFGAC
jgi:hypothetical protein